MIAGLGINVGLLETAVTVSVCVSTEDPDVIPVKGMVCVKTLGSILVEITEGTLGVAAGEMAKVTSSELVAPSWLKTITE